MEAIQEAFTGICREIFNQHYPDPFYEQLRWVILLGALFAFLLPWLCGYRLGEKVPYSKKRPLLHFVQKLASNDNFDIVFRQVENLEAHIFKISVSICLAKHSPHFVIESLHGGIG